MDVDVDWDEEVEITIWHVPQSEWKKLREALGKFVEYEGDKSFVVSLGGLELVFFTR